MSIYLRQICLVAEQLEPVVEQIENLFGVPICHRDPEVATFGLENALFAFGSQFLEVVAPIREGTAAISGNKHLRCIQVRINNGGYCCAVFPGRMCMPVAHESGAHNRDRQLLCFMHT